MRFVADLHVHSKYSRACSPELVPENIDKWCQLKGIDLVGTGDFTHPGWMAELKTKLILNKNGFYTIDTNHKNHDGEGLTNLDAVQGKSEVRSKQYLYGIVASTGAFDEEMRQRGKSCKTYFVPTAEISCIYSKNGKVRRIHLIVVVKTLAIAQKLNDRLSKIGNLHSDGRPILGLDAKELTKYVFECSPDSLVVPAHIWTPWFSLFGSKSGFDSIEECFEEMSPHIHAIETGLSSNPPMNWMIKGLDNIAIMSNSDAHSLGNLGREANVFEGTELSYETFCKAITDKNEKAKSRSEQSSATGIKLVSTIEFYPEEGKYHLDGHADCKISLTPKETKKIKNICPICKTGLTIGVLSRVEELAGRKMGDKPETALNYKSIVPLQEIVAEVLGVGKQSKAVQKTYFQLLNRFGSEFNILLDTNLEELLTFASPFVAEGIRRVRSGEINIIPGYDGIYGKVKIFKDGKLAKLKGALMQTTI